MARKTAAEEFHTSSGFGLPSGFDAWKIRNDYPRSSDVAPSEDKPWLRVDFKTEPEKYCNLLKEYFFRGNTENNFVVQKNKVRDWYHAPWLHYGDRGREPINGLKFGGYLPPGYISKEQTEPVQAWLSSYFNWESATILGDMWANSNKIPKWDNHIKFPVGSVHCDLIFCDMTDNVPIAKGSPEFKASIGKLPENWHPGDEKAPVRSNDEFVVKTLRLVQADFIARDDRSPIGWVFGAYVCDGRMTADDPWDKVFPIGLQYGNDPDLLQKEYDAGKRPTQLWLNPDAVKLREELKGTRPWFGWHDRLDGLVSDFMSTCTSCHATAQLSPPGRTRTPFVQDPKPQQDENGKWVQKHEEVERIWFRNLPHGTPFDDDSLSADYSRHVEFPYKNYLDWEAKGGNK